MAGHKTQALIKSLKREQTRKKGTEGYTQASTYSFCYEWTKKNVNFLSIQTNRPFTTTSTCHHKHKYIHIHTCIDTYSQVYMKMTMKLITYVPAGLLLQFSFPFLLLILFDKTLNLYLWLSEQPISLLAFYEDLSGKKKGEAGRPSGGPLTLTKFWRKMVL